MSLMWLSQRARHLLLLELKHLLFCSEVFLYLKWAFMSHHGVFQTRGIPFLVFDVGGVLEMLDEQANSDSVILQLTTEALYSKVNGQSSPRSCFMTPGHKYGICSLHQDFKRATCNTHACILSILQITNIVISLYFQGFLNCWEGFRNFYRSFSSVIVLNESSKALEPSSLNALPWRKEVYSYKNRTRMLYHGLLVRNGVCAEVLTQGDMKTAQLSEKVTTGKQQWLDWHSELATMRIPTLQQVWHLCSALPKWCDFQREGLCSARYSPSCHQSKSSWHFALFDQNQLPAIDYN